MNDNWNEETQISVHCIGCGRKSPTQRMPTPFCPDCCHEPRIKSYWRAYLDAIRPLPPKADDWVKP